MAFVVRDELAKPSDWNAIRRRGRVTIGVPPIREFELKVRAQLPEAQIVHLSSADEVFSRLEARAYSNSPTGTNFLIIGIGQTGQARV
jgi:hypothetical protein